MSASAQATQEIDLVPVLTQSLVERQARQIEELRAENALLRVKLHKTLKFARDNAEQLEKIAGYLDKATQGYLVWKAGG